MNHIDASPFGKVAGQHHGEIAHPDPLAVVRRGLAIFPLPRGGRVPTIKDWPNRCITDPAVIARHWRPGGNIGVGCRASGIVGIDLDRHKADADGVDTFTRLCETHGQEWPHTLTVRTPRKGLHLYFRAPAERALGNTSGKLGLGVDSRGPGRGSDGGYLVGPGSIVDGIAYEIVRDAPVADLPGWLAELLDPPRPRPTAPHGSPLPLISDRYARAAHRGEIERLLAAGDGQRNHELNRAAFVLGTLVGGGLLDRDVAEQSLRDAAAALGLEADPNCGPRQIETTIQSGLNAGCARPRVTTRRAR